MQVKETEISTGLVQRIGFKAKAYFELLKFRLTTFVVLSAIFGYLMAPHTGAIDWVGLVVVMIGGFLVTGASNTFNQVLEQEFDLLMSRTRNRPLPSGRVSPSEGVTLALVSGVLGIVLLGWYFNLVAALLGIVALLSYAFVYTPLKRISRVSVLVGAFPGAMPTLIGWAAVTGDLGIGAWILFGFQFIWQFPHFWAIAWLLDDDYKKAGFKMLPSASGKSSFTATIILLYTALLIPLSFLPFKMDMVGWVSLVVIGIAGIYFTFQSFMLLRKLDAGSARKLMLGSFLYLPVIQMAFMFSKYFG